MKKIFFFIVVIFPFDSFSQDTNATFNRQLLVEEIISTYAKIQVLENKYEESNSNEYEDSISIANYSLVQLLLDKKFTKLNNSDLKKIREKTEIKIIFSEDKKLTVVSWHVFNSYQVPMCSNLMFYEGATKIISLNGTGDSDFGDNIQNDRIYQVRLNGKAYYILTGSNKCGNLCILEMASLYFISNGNIIKCSNSFFDGKKYFADVQFDYLINNDMKVEPAFQIQGNKLIYPIFNKDKTKIIGSKRFEITVPPVLCSMLNK